MSPESLVNCVPYVLTCQRVLRASCSRSNLSACLRTNVSYVFTCSRANVPCVLTCPRDNVLTCSSAKIPCVLTCSRVNVPQVLTSQCVFRAYVFTCFVCLRAHVPCLPKCLHAITSNNKKKFSVTCFTYIFGTFSLFFS